MIDAAIQHYHDLLTEQVAADSQAHLDRLTELRDMRFGARPVCSVLRPRFLSLQQLAILESAVARLTTAFSLIYSRGISDAAFREQFRLTPDEEVLIGFDPGFDNPSPTARLDSFFVSERELKFTEFNSETPAGAGYNDVLTELFWGMPVVREFSRRYRLRPLPGRPHVLQALLDTYQTWSNGAAAQPRIAILDWKEVPTFSEFRVFESYFTEQGLEARIVDPREVEYTNGKLRSGDFEFDLIYKRVLISELLERDGGLESKIVRAVRDRACCMVNGFRCKLLFKKASFAVLSDERNASMFGAQERSAISEFIPWTRVVEERKTQRHGLTIDLVPHMLAHRESFVLKPNDDYGGHGIVLGWTVNAGAWESAVRCALASPYVVQERVNLPHEVYPGYEAGKLAFLDRMLDTNPFLGPSGGLDACLTRISTEALLNVTAGGGSTVPTLLVESR